MSALRKHLGKARYGAIAIVAVLIAVIALYPQLRRARAAMVIPTSEQMAVGLIRVGLDPEALAAAGVQAIQVPAVIGDVFEHLSGHQGQIEGTDASWADLRRQCAKLKRVIQSGQASAEQIAAYSQATSQLTSVEAQRQDLEDAVFDAGTAGLNQSQASLLAAIRSNRHWKLPLEFLVVDRTEPQWVALAEALANERISAEYGQAPDPGAQALLAAARSDPQVATATINLETSQAAVESAWEQQVDAY